MHNLNVPKSRSVLLQLFFFSPTKADSVPHTGPNSIPFASITITLPCRSQQIAQGNEALNKRLDSLQEVMTWLPTRKLKREHWNWQQKRKCFYWKPQRMGITTIAMKIITKCKTFRNYLNILETDKLGQMCLVGMTRQKATWEFYSKGTSFLQPWLFRNRSGLCKKIVT